MALACAGLGLACVSGGSTSTATSTASEMSTDGSESPSGSGSGEASDGTPGDGDPTSEAESGDGDPGDGDPGDGDGDPGPIEVEQVVLPYGEHGEDLALYLPAPAASPALTTVVLAHGGLWQGGDKLALATLCEGIVQASSGALACASINYRLSDDLGGSCQGVGVDTYLDQARDFAAAVVSLQDQAETHGLDPARMVLGGHSAGGHLAALLELRWAALAPACAGPGDCPAPIAALGFEGIYDIAAWDAYDASYWNGQFACATRKAFGAPPDAPSPCLDQDLGMPCWEAGSPRDLAEHSQDLGLAPLGPILLIHSPADDWVDLAEATQFAATMSAAFPTLDVQAVTDGSCGSGRHNDILGEPELASCIASFAQSATP